LYPENHVIALWSTRGRDAPAEPDRGAGNSSGEDGGMRQAQITVFFTQRSAQSIDDDF
jgi:hypothetical protein